MNVLKRQKFNLPLRCITRRHEKSGDFIASYSIKGPAMIWLDYASPRELRVQVEEYEALISRLQLHDIVKITLNANPDTLVSRDSVDENGKREAWTRVLKLDERQPLDQPLLSEAEMATVAEQALSELPERARKLIQNVPILIADLPAGDDVATGLDPRLVGLFSGTPHPDASHLGGVPQLTQILLFRKNLERVAEGVEELRDEIRTTLLHETGHFFGMSEEDLEAVGLE